jgi:outer membrane protein assembly factor BamD
MILKFTWPLRALVVVTVLTLPAVSSLRKKKYENPISKETQQPDKVLFDKAMNDIEHGRYEIARLTLNTLINTYDSSEFLAKAKLAIADSWFREGGSNGLAQAEAEYKDFILFYPQMQESAEAQDRICQIHINQMSKAERDDTQGRIAEQECKKVITDFPNSKFAPLATQKLRDIQEILAAHEVASGNFYFKRGAYPAAANRLDGAVNQFPLYSESDEALLKAGESYLAMDKKRFRQQAISDFSRIVRDYPGNPRIVEQAKRHLTDLEAPIPEPNPEALALLKYNKEHYVKPSLVHRELGIFVTGAPDMSYASKKGEPTMTAMKSTIPLSVPVPVETASAQGTGGQGTGTNDVSVQQLKGDSKLDTAPDARTSAAATGVAATTATETAVAPGAPPPTNHAKDIAAAQADAQKRAKKNKKKATTQPASTTPAIAPETAPAQPTSTDPNAPAAQPTQAPPATGSAPTPSPQPQP